MTLSEYVSAYLKEHDMSIRSFSRLSGISPQYISCIIAGKNNDGKPLSPTMKIYKKIANATGVDEITLLTAVTDKVQVNGPGDDIEALDDNLEKLKSIYHSLTTDNVEKLIEYANMLYIMQSSKKQQ